MTYELYALILCLVYIISNSVQFIMFTVGDFQVFAVFII
jgi:hypothetical protein